MMKYLPVVLLSFSILAQEYNYTQPMEYFLTIVKREEEIETEIRKHKAWIAENRKYIKKFKAILDERDPYVEPYLNEEIKKRAKIIKNLRDERCRILFQKKEIEKSFEDVKVIK